MFPPVNITAGMKTWASHHPISATKQGALSGADSHAHTGCLDVLRLFFACFHKELTCMLSADLWTKATQSFFIYPPEIPQEDSSPLLSFHPLLCMPAVMTILLLHSHPTSTPVTISHLYRASAAWNETVNIFGTCLCTVWTEVYDFSLQVSRKC